MMWPFRRKPAPAPDPAPLPLTVLTDLETRIRAARLHAQARFDTDGLPRHYR